MGLKSEKADEMMRELEKSIKLRHEGEIKVFKDKLEVESNKLEDCHREIEIYRQQLEHATSEVDQLKTEMKEQMEMHSEAKNEIISKNKAEWDNQEKKLLLEHEP